MSKMYLLEPRVSEEDRLWAEELYDIKRLNEKIDEQKRKSLIVGIIVLPFCIFFLIASLFVYQGSFSQPPEYSVYFYFFAIFFGIAGLSGIYVAISLLREAKKGSKYLITQKNVLIEALVEEKNKIQSNTLSEGDTNE